MIDAELLIVPDLDLAALAKVTERIDKAMKVAAKRAGAHFEREIAAGIRRGIAKGGMGGAFGPVAGGAGGGARPPATPQAEIFGPMITGPESPAAFRARLRREAAQEERAARKEQAERVKEDARIEKMRRDFELRDLKARRAEEERIAKYWTLGGVGSRLKSRVKGMNIFAAGGMGLGALTLAAPFGISGIAGMWGMMNAGGIRDNVQKAFDDLLANSTARNRINAAGMMGLSLPSMVALERQFSEVGGKEGELSGILQRIHGNLSAKNPFLKRYEGMRPGQAIPQILADLASYNEADRMEAMNELGVASPELNALLNAARKRAGGGKVSISDVINQRKQDIEEAKNLQKEALTVQKTQAELTKITNQNTAMLVERLGEKGTLGTYLENVKEQNKRIQEQIDQFGSASGVANTLEATMSKLNTTLLKESERWLPTVQKIAAMMEKIIGASGEAVDTLTPSPQRKIQNLTDQNEITTSPTETYDLAVMLAAVLDGWVKRNFGSQNQQPQQGMR